jgi:hypothetical protein
VDAIEAAIGPRCAEALANAMQQIEDARMNDPRKLRKAVYIPFAFSVLLVVLDVLERLLYPGDAGGAARSALWFLPMCFFFVANAQLTLMARIEELEAKSK